MCMPPSWPTICFCQVSMFELKGRVALVTGGNGGIGLGMAQGLAAAGATLALAGRDEKKNAAAAKALGGRVISIKVDLRDENACRAAVDQAAQKLGRLDILVNNAGTNIRKAPQDYTLEEWRLGLDTNLTSAVIASQAADPPMKRAGGAVCLSGSSSDFVAGVAIRVDGGYSAQG